MTAGVTGNMALVAGAPNGISKLRELILDLAVRGKLVNATESTPFGMNAGGQDLTAVWPFEIPGHWRWCRLAGLEPSFQNGASSRGDAEGVPVIVIRLADIKDGEISLGDSRTLTLAASTVQKYELAAGDILVIRVNGSADLVGRFVVCRNSIDAIPCDHFIRARFPDGVVHPSYMKIVGDCRATRSAVSGLFVSTAGQKTVNQGHIGSIAIPMPPLAEQHRIVARVDELMALCDRLEAKEADAEAAHAQLVQALLASLTQARDAADFRACWQQLAEHFHTLFTTEASVDALKQTVLQLGVMGKLVAQQDDDEPASQLMKRLKSDRARWLVEQQEVDAECRSMARKLSQLTPAKAPFDIPPSWLAVRLLDCSRLLVDCHNKTAPYSATGIPIIRTSNIRNRRFRLDDLRYVSEETYAFWSRRCTPEPGDIMFTREAPMGEAAIIPDEARYCLGQRTMLIRPMHEYVEKEYLLLALTEPHLLERASTVAIGSTVKHLRVGDVESLSLPIPPLAEQKRIVKKVTELLALCDQLKLSLSQARQQHAHLAAVLVEQALSA